MQDIPESKAGYLAHLVIYVIGLKNTDKFPKELLANLVQMKIDGKVKHKDVVRYILHYLSDKPEDLETSIKILAPIVGGRKAAIKCIENIVKARLLTRISEMEIENKINSDGAKEQHPKSPNLLEETK